MAGPARLADRDTPAARSNLEAADSANPLRCARVGVVLEGTALEHLRPERRPGIFKLSLRSAAGDPGPLCAVPHLVLSLPPGIVEQLLALLLLGPLLRFLLGAPGRLDLAYLVEALLDGLLLLIVFPL